MCPCPTRPYITPAVAQWASSPPPSSHHLRTSTNIWDPAPILRMRICLLLVAGAAALPRAQGGDLIRWKPYLTITLSLNSQWYSTPDQVQALPYLYLTLPFFFFSLNTWSGRSNLVFSCFSAIYTWLLSDPMCLPHHSYTSQVWWNWTLFAADTYHYLWPTNKNLKSEILFPQEWMGGRGSVGKRRRGKDGWHFLAWNQIFSFED